MCNQSEPKFLAYIKSNWAQPNLIVKHGRAAFDLSATLMKVERGYGSNTECDEKEAWRRRVMKEQLKLNCIAYALGAELETSIEDNVSYWMQPATVVGDDTIPTIYEQFGLNGPLHDDELEKKTGASS